MTRVAVHSSLSQRLWQWLLRAAIVGAMLMGSALVLRAQASVASASPSSSALPRDQRRVTFAVATRALARGETLTAADMITMDTVITWRWATPPDSTRPAAGWVTRRAIAAGEVLREPAVTPPPVITAGSTVTAIWQDGSLRLVLAGTATNTAALGAPVGIRIDRSRRLDGVAAGPNLIRLR